MLFDTHCHPYITFKKSSPSLLEDFFGDASENRCISIGCDIESSKKSIELAQKYPRLKASIGFHPCDIDYSCLYSQIEPSSQFFGQASTSKLSLRSVSHLPFQEKMRLQIEQDISELRNLYHKNKQYIVAIGETGLDYYHLESISEKSGFPIESTKEIQEAYFRAQIHLARELNLPFVIHSRESNEEVYEILVQEQAHNYVFHCYSGDWTLAQKILLQNPHAMFGFGGVLTYKKSLEHQVVSRNLSLANILLETDAPFLTPEPLRGKEENEPIFTSYVLKKLQELRDESPEDIEKAVYENGKRFFNI